jgi:hypothetical protein
MAKARGRRVAAWAAMALAATGCGLAGTTGGRGAGGGTFTGTRPPHSAQLTAYRSCSQMLDQLRGRALAVVGPSGLAGVETATRASAPLAASGALASPAMAGATPAAGSGGASGNATGSGASAFSPTNDQELGVDEPDLAKTDGHLLVTLRHRGNDLEVADVSGAPALLGSLALDQQLSPTGLFLVGHDAVVLGDTYASSPETEVVVVDLTSPDHPAVARSFTVQGQELDARLIAGRVELVVQSAPQLPLVAPSDPTPGAAAQALSANRAAIARSTPADWLPTVTSEPSGTVTTAPCTSAMQAGSSQGLDTVSVVPIDPSADQPGPAVTVVGDGSTVYASATTLYIAAPAWPAPTPVPSGGPVPLPSEAIPSGRPQQTDIYGFDLSDPGAPRYIGAGQVPGTLIGQYAMSAYQGYLRVATTVGDATPPPTEGTAPAVPSDNRVTVLQAQGGALVPVAQVTGLGAGEKIYAVRFIGPLGYVVTFHQTDPLYVLDLSDPLRPQLSGQLALDGYSSFLEPLSGNLLLGVGQSVDANLRVQGLQVSLFDVSDPAAPKLLGKDVLAGASSPAESDPHALLYWAPTGTVVLPVRQYQYEDPAGSPGSPFDGAVAFGVAGTLREVGRVSQPAAANLAPIPMPACQSCAVSMPAMGADAGIERALVVGSMLYTVSEAGIMASDLTTYAPQAWLAYPA